jgi:U1 small nuclear ribonucleoprotein A
MSHFDKSKQNEENTSDHEKSLFSTIMKGTPNLLDLIDPGKVSDSAFSSHKKPPIAFQEESKSKPKSDDNPGYETSIPIVEETKEDNSEELTINSRNIHEQEKMPDLPMPMGLPVPIIEEEPNNEETQEIPKVETKSIFKVSSEEISTLYVKNLNEKINLTDLKYSLNFMFSQFGEVISIQVSKKNQLRGQAFITFAKPGEARRALKSLQGLSFFKKELNIQLAKTKSLASFIYEGKFHNLSERIHALRKSKVGIKTMLKDTEPAEAKHLLRTASQVLSVQNFPENLTVDRFKLLFRQFPGFKSARLVPERKVGLVEFYDKAQAMMALKKYEGFMMDEQHLLKVRFAQQDE